MSSTPLEWFAYVMEELWSNTKQGYGEQMKDIARNIVQNFYNNTNILPIQSLEIKEIIEDAWEYRNLLDREKTLIVIESWQKKLDTVFQNENISLGNIDTVVLLDIFSEKIMDYIENPNQDDTSTLETIEEVVSHRINGFTSTLAWLFLLRSDEKDNDTYDQYINITLTKLESLLLELSETTDDSMTVPIEMQVSSLKKKVA